MRGSSHAAFAAMLAASTLVQVPAAAPRAPGAVVIGAASRPTTPAQSLQASILNQVAYPEQRGGGRGGRWNGFVWQGRAKAARGGNARWDYRR